MGYNNSSMASWSGKTLGKVEIGEMIARGGMAEVYYGEHVMLNRKVAVKIMRDHVDDDPESRARFEREARVVAGLHHPNIIQIFDYDLTDGRPCIVMELVQGVSLAGYLKAIQKRGEKLNFREMSRLLLPIASAIDYAHSHQIVHRDIKPANILLRSNSGQIDVNAPLPADVEPVLTDFGLVRLLDSSIQTSTGTVSGTPAYMSPEQARGDKVDRKTDIYSLGVVLYEMLAGNVPFDAESTFGVLMKHLNDPPPPIAGISSDLQLVIDRALSKESATRYNTATDFINEFIAIFNGQTISSDTMSALKAVRPSTAEKTQAKKPIFSVAYAGIAVGVIALIALGIFLFRPEIVLDPRMNRPVGRVTYDDFNFVMDQALISINELPVPDKGTHYEVWYLAQGGEFRRNVGRIEMDGEVGQVTFVDPQSDNILALYDQVEITIEPDNDPNPDQPSGEIAASSVFPPLALVHVRHLVVSYSSAPEGTALIQGLWATVDNIDTSVLEMQDAYVAGDEELVRAKTEEIINQLAGKGNEDYKDWDQNGKISNPSDNYGLLENEENGITRGYVPTTISHANFAADAPDATENIKTQADHVVTSIDNIEGWASQLLHLATELQETPFGTDMEPLIADMVNLSSQMLYGVDTNANGLIEPIVGEGGADTAYTQAYQMADMPLLTGEHRIPPPASTDN